MRRHLKLRSLSCQAVLASELCAQLGSTLLSWEHGGRQGVMAHVLPQGYLRYGIRFHIYYVDRAVVFQSL